MAEKSIGLVELSSTMGLREECVEAEKDTGDTEGDGVVENLTERGGRDSESRVRHVADHDRVHNAHRHPANLREHEWDGQGKDRSDLVSDGHDCGNVLASRYPLPPYLNVSKSSFDNS